MTRRIKISRFSIFYVCRKFWRNFDRFDQSILRAHLSIVRGIVLHCTIPPQYSYKSNLTFNIPIVIFGTKRCKTFSTIIRSKLLHTSIAATYRHNNTYRINSTRINPWYIHTYTDTYIVIQVPSLRFLGSRVFHITQSRLKRNVWNLRCIWGVKLLNVSSTVQTAGVCMYRRRWMLFRVHVLEIG